MGIQLSYIQLSHKIMICFQIPYKFVIKFLIKVWFMHGAAYIQEIPVLRAEL